MTENKSQKNRLTEQEYSYMKGRLEDQMNWYDKKSCTNQALYKRHTIFQFLAGLSAPMVSLYSVEASAILIYCLVFSLILCMLGKWQENWIKYRTTCEILKKQKMLYENRSGVYSGEDRFKILVERTESLISPNNSQQ